MLTQYFAPSMAEDWRKEFYEEELPELLDGERRAQRSLDKLLRWLSGGALALSLAFYQQMAPTPSELSLLILQAGWVLLILSLASLFFSLITMKQAFRRERDLLDEFLEGKIDRPSERLNRWDTATTVCNWFSTATALLGVVAVVVFAWMNLNRGSTDAPPARQGQWEWQERGPAEKVPTETQRQRERGESASSSGPGSTG